jgi:hypothetical protein
MSKKTFNLALYFFSLLMLFSSCKYESNSFGDFEKIFVIADSTFYKNLKPELEQVFDNYVYTPHSEKSFYLEYLNIKSLNNYSKRRNLLFLALLDGNDETSQYISQLLSNEVKQAVHQGNIFYIFREDFLTKDQMCVILIGNDETAIRNNLITYKDEIFDEMDEYHFKRLEKIMFLKAEQVALEDYFWENLGWRIRIQHDYHVVKESDSGNFVWLRRFKPDRNIFIYRFKGDSSALNEDNIIYIRDSLGVVYFEGDSVSREDTYAKFENFKEYPALTLTGVWQNHKHYIGGPFKLYALFEKSSGQIYIIDMLVTAPGKRKKPFLDQLDVMGRTFTIK